MPLSIPLTTLTANYADGTFGGGSLYSNGQLLILNGAVDLQIDYGNNVGLVETFEVQDLPQGQYAVSRGSELFVIGLRLRAAVASGVSSPAQQVQGSFYEPKVPNITPVGGGAGNPFSGSGSIDITDGVLDINPATELFVGQGVVLTNPASGEARIDVNATGVQLAYQEITSSVTITGTPSSQQTVFTLGPVTYDGSTRIRIEAYTPTFDILTSGGEGNLIAGLWDGSTDLGVLAQANIEGVAGSSDLGWPMNQIRFLTPSAGAHTFTIRYYRTVGTPTIAAGAGGALTYVPAWARISIA